MIEDKILIEIFVNITEENSRVLGYFLFRNKFTEKIIESLLSGLNMNEHNLNCLQTFSRNIKIVSHCHIRGSQRLRPEQNWKIYPGGVLGYILGGYVPPGSPNLDPVLERICTQNDTPF